MPAFKISIWFKITPRAWYERLRQSLLELDFTISPSNPSIFIQKTATDVTIVLIYVDDILLTSSFTQICQAIITALGNFFPVKDLGDAKYFLGLELHRTNGALYITQSKYIVDLLRRAKWMEPNLPHSHFYKFETR